MGQHKDAVGAPVRVDVRSEVGSVVAARVTRTRAGFRLYVVFSRPLRRSGHVTLPHVTEAGAFPA